MAGYAPNKTELVKFQKLKMKYFQNEDIKVEYVLHPKLRQYPRDWIGLYPAEWNNLQQYVTFEWAVCRPCDEKSPYRTEIFKHKYHSEAISFDKQYQLVYVNKYMKVLGRSAHFGFLPPMPFSGVVKSDVSMLQSQQNGLKRAPSVYKLLKPTIPPLKLTDVNQLPINQNKETEEIQHITEEQAQKLQQQFRQPNHFDNVSQSSQTDKCLPEADLQQNSEQEVDPNAPSQLEKESHNLCENESNDKEVKCTTAEEIVYLQNRVKELELALEKSRASQRILKISAQRSKREKVSYQNFVSLLLENLSKKQIVRVIDGERSELLVKCVQSLENENEQSPNPKPNCVKETPKERRLKAIIGFQEQTIQLLQQRLASFLKEKESSEQGKQDKKDQVGSSESEPLFTVVRKSMPSTTGISAVHTDDVSEQKNEMATNLNDVIVSSVDEIEPQTCIQNAEATEVHVDEYGVEEILPECIVSGSGDYVEQPQSSALIVLENNIESGGGPDTEVMFIADTVTATDETEKVDVLTAPSPSRIVICDDRVSFRIEK